MFADANKVTFKGSGNRLILVLAALVSIVCLVAINVGVIHFFFGSIARTGTAHLMNKTELDELGFKLAIEDQAEAAELLIKRSGSDLNREIIKDFSSFTNLVDFMWGEFRSAILDLKKTNLAEEVDKLNANMLELPENMNEFDVHKPNGIFRFESDVTELLYKANFGKKWRSQFFFCRGLAWSLYYTNLNNPSFLNVYLEVHNHESTSWNVETSFKITILNQSGKSPTVSRWSTDRVFSNEDSGWGVPDLIFMDHLKSGGFIKDNKIVLEIELIVKQLVRNDLVKLN